MTEFECKVLRIFMHNPKSFPTLFNQMFKNSSYAYKILNKYLPTDTGLEFEVGEEIVKGLFSTDLKKYFKRDSYFEVTKRVTKHKEYYHIYQLIELINNCYAFPKNGGIHIHTNVFSKRIKSSISSFIRSVNSTKLIKRLAEYFKYTGTYNELDAASTKGHFLTFRSDFNTLEWRGIPMQSDFTQLMKYIIVCHYCTKMIVEEDINLISLEKLISSLDLI